MLGILCVETVEPFILEGHHSILLSYVSLQEVQWNEAIWINRFLIELLHKPNA